MRDEAGTRAVASSYTEPVATFTAAEPSITPAAHYCTFPPYVTYNKTPFGEPRDMK